MKRPNVIDPPDFEFDYDCDPGVCSCPCCGEFYEMAGRVIRCEQCGFEFPTDWWGKYSKGCSDGLRVRAGAVQSKGMARRAAHHPYYRQGLEHPAGEAWKAKDCIDWKSVVGPIGSLPVLRDYSYCDRCGEDKTDGRENRSGLCQRCAGETDCKYLAREQGDSPGYDYVCRVGMDIKLLVGDEPGWMTRLPCRYWEGGCPRECRYFEPIGLAAVQRDDEQTAIAIAKTLVAFSVVPEIKDKHKGEDWVGVVECPVCQGRLHVSHAAYNGHVHGRCESEDCVSWME